jgi:hypothetical protein
MTAVAINDVLCYARALRLLPEGAVVRAADGVTMRKWKPDGWIVCQPDGDLPSTMPHDTFPSEAVFLPAQVISLPTVSVPLAWRTRITVALIAHCLVMAHNGGCICACSKGFTTLQEHIDHQADHVLAELAKEH